MWPLAALAAALWYCLAWRMVTLRRGSRLPVRDLVRLRRGGGREPGSRDFVTAAVDTALAVRAGRVGDVRRLLDCELAPLEAAVRRHGPAVRTIVGLAPMVGLLGTVSGMIGLFGALGAGAATPQGSGIADGISQALLTTEFGLSIAVPGLVIGRLLDARERRIRGEIGEVRNLLGASS